MNFIEDATWQDDPSVIVSDITTQGSYALTVNGAFNAASLNINGTDITNIFANANDLNSNINTNFLRVNNILYLNLFVMLVNLWKLI
jgi:hypothetical protein